jgi:Outer membrane protein beta-barrel domain
VFVFYLNKNVVFLRFTTQNNLKMKKLFFATVAVFAFGISNAQEARFGAKGGVNFSNFGGDADDADMKVGFAIGGFAEVKFSDKFAVQPELLFTLLGAKRRDIYANLNYIAIPLMAKYFVA